MEKDIVQSISKKIAYDLNAHNTSVSPHPLKTYIARIFGVRVSNVIFFWGLGGRRGGNLADNGIRNTEVLELSTNHDMMALKQVSWLFAHPLL